MKSAPPWLAVLVAALLAACPATEHNDGGGADDHDDGLEAMAVTHWTETAELFVEFPPLVMGQESPFAAHFTRLSDFKPVDRGRVTVLLSGGGLAEERFVATEALVAGIFRPVAWPQHTGRRRLILRLESEGLTSTHDLGEMTVFPHLDAARSAAGQEEAPGRQITFLKEQQWRIEFATATVTERTLRPSLRANGRVVPRADGELWVTAPISGRLATAGRAYPTLGAEVTADQVLVEIAPRLGAGSDIPSLELAVEQARLDLTQAQRERQRLEGLYADGAVAQRRVVEARHDEERVRASVTAAERRLAQHQRLERTAGKQGADAVTVRAPIAGTITAVKAPAGGFLEAGQEIFHIVDLDRLWLEVRIPEVDVARILHPAGAWFEIGGYDPPIEVERERLVAAGGVIDPRTRTIPLIFAIDNPERHLRVGMSVQVHVLTGEPVTDLAVPVTAVVDDGGQDVVYVQPEGEAFERRIVHLGIRDRGYVQVLEGVERDEHVVTRGAYAVKLAASATQLPAHGHAH